MFVVLLFLVVISLVGLLMHFNSKLFLGFFCCFAGIFSMMASTIIYSLRLATYPYFNNIDHFLYLLFMNYPITLETSSRIYSIGMAATMLSMTHITHVTTRKNTVYTPISVLSVLLFLFINEPLVCERLFYEVNSYTLFNYQSFLEKSIQMYSYFVFIIHLTLPVIMLILHYFKLKLHINKRIISATFMTQLSVSVFLIYQYNFTIHRVYAPWNMDLLRFPIDHFYTMSSNTTVPTILMLIVFFALMIALNPFDLFKITTKKGYQKNAQELNHNLRMVLHSDKNILVTIDKLSEQTLELKDKYPHIVEQNLKDIRSVVDDGLTHLSRTIDLINDVPKIDGQTDIIECIEKALKNLSCSDIRIERNYEFDSVYINAHSVHITECFVNLFQNCIEAIHSCRKNNGTISVDVSIEEPYICVQITDNGCGIPKNKIKSIFSPFVSTKQSAKNWGIGLNYVQNVVNLYNGNIWVKSVVNSYTTFQITFPIKIGKEQKKWINR